MKTKVLITGGGPGRPVVLREAEFAVPEIVAYLLAITQFRSR